MEIIICFTNHIDEKYSVIIDVHFVMKWSICCYCLCFLILLFGSVIIHIISSVLVHYCFETSVDKFIYLKSFHDGKKWTLKYGTYQQVGQYQLATKFTIKQEDLTIKINVHQWDVTINE